MTTQIASSLARRSQGAPLVGVTGELRFAKERAGAEIEFEAAREAVAVASWSGIVLPEAVVLGVRVFPVVLPTGAASRIRCGSGPVLCLTTLSMWEAFTLSEWALAPVAIVGFVSANPRWVCAVSAVASLSGLGSGLVARGNPLSTLQRLETDALDVWAVGPRADGELALEVTGRLGPIPTARRTAATRMIEEHLFGHALRSGSLSSLL